MGIASDLDPASFFGLEDRIEMQANSVLELDGPTLPAPEQDDTIPNKEVTTEPKIRMG
jgi:hypothetical protein